MIDCDVIQDLLPLYADKQTSDASNRLIDSHIRTCRKCRDLMQKMCAPLEQEPADEEAAYISAIRRQKRKNRNRIIIACVLTVILCVAGWWLYMETHFYGETPVVVSTDDVRLLEEMPVLALTQDELSLADSVLDIPAIHAVMQQEGIHTIAAAEVYADIAAVLPADAVVSEVCVTNNVIYIDYQVDSLRTTLDYVDADNNHSIDSVSKTVAVLEEDGDVRVVYTAQHVPVINKTWYEKHRMKHIWFSFLDMS